jgi:hypothetical protein
MAIRAHALIAVQHACAITIACMTVLFPFIIRTRMPRMTNKRA